MVFSCQFYLRLDPVIIMRQKKPRPFASGAFFGFSPAPKRRENATSPFNRKPTGGFPDGGSTYFGFMVSVADTDVFTLSVIV